MYVFSTLCLSLNVLSYVCNYFVFCLILSNKNIYIYVLVINVHSHQLFMSANERRFVNQLEEEVVSLHSFIARVC